MVIFEMGSVYQRLTLNRKPLTSLGRCVQALKSPELLLALTDRIHLNPHSPPLLVSHQRNTYFFYNKMMFSFDAFI